MSNLYGHGFWVEPKFKKKLEAHDIERIVEKDREGWDWGRQLDWINMPEMPFLKPTILKNGTVIWPFCQIHPNAKIGKNVVIGCFTNISPTTF